MRDLYLIAVAIVGATSVSSAASAQHTGHMMPGMQMPAAKRARAPTPRPTPATSRPRAPVKRADTPEPHRGPASPADPIAATHDHATMPDAGTAVQDHAHASHATAAAPVPDSMPMDHSGHDIGAMGGMEGVGTDSAPDMSPAGTALPAGNAAPPPLPTDHYAERDYPAGMMAAARAQMMREQGGQTLHQLFLNLAEVQVRRGRDGYRWDGEAWIGGDINRLVVKSEGEGAYGDAIDDAEVQALYSRAIGPYFDLQAGVRHDFAPTPSRTYATIGVEGLAPYWFDVEAAAFLSTRDEVLGRIEGWYDQRLTQRFVLQPRAELNLSAQDVRETGVGAGLVDAELGLRLRYEIARTFAPYLGVSYRTLAGRSATFARRSGDGTAGTSLVAGVRFWF